MSFKTFFNGSDCLIPVSGEEDKRVHGDRCSTNDTPNDDLILIEALQGNPLAYDILFD